MASFVRPVRREEVKFALETEQELDSPETHFSEDPEVLGWIRNEIRRGNPFGWCTVVVKAKWGAYVGEATLGCCSYESEESFRTDGCLADLEQDALVDLNQVIERTARSLASLVTKESFDEWIVAEVQGT